MRLDASSTVQLNASERTDCADHNPCSGTPEPDSYAPATFLDASANGERAFFITTQALTDDTPTDGTAHIYMYDARLSPSAPHHLTLINPDNEPGDPGSSNVQIQGIVGLSDDGHYVYFVTIGQIVSGQTLLAGAPGLYLWHEGTVRYITSVAGTSGWPVGVVSETDGADVPAVSLRRGWRC
jgi:hypothetical protein